jgi:hypothetical protein
MLSEMTTNRYKIKVIKETILDLDSDQEAEQIAELYASRETGSKMLGGVAFVYSDYELVTN